MLRARCPECGAAHGAALAFCTECGGHLQPDTGPPGLSIPALLLWTAMLCLGIATAAYLTA